MDFYVNWEFIHGSGILAVSLNTTSMKIFFNCIFSVTIRAIFKTVVSSVSQITTFIQPGKK